ncbi:cadherin-like beta sandwich domain-containing protein [Paenibacillus sp. JCM 10914]|uniref:fibronectin type III domain-containing protein n=1 Tax=Paenibacillus sp. JCM 10914 TaxID=1236974 RepID=UPI0003CC6C5C|nr:cadherin-like beta sandwich domain-containing protein [Paenibacillus sp. JCM 10914]GAE09434.1 hypothetical protein JCM10914_5794 [Paenibacillus sp. JCM 10914]
MTRAISRNKWLVCFLTLVVFFAGLTPFVVKAQPNKDISSNHQLNQMYMGPMNMADEPDAVTDIQLDPKFFSPNGDGAAKTTDITYTINQALDYFSLDVYDAETETLTWKGTIVEIKTGIGVGRYIVREWDASVTDLMDQYVLDEGSYVIIPWFGDSTSISHIQSQQAPFVIDNHAPVSELDEPAITVTGNEGVISGLVRSDLMIDIVGDYSAIRVFALYESNGWKQADGIIHSDGSFQIKVPVSAGYNSFGVYVYDAALNGVKHPAHVVEYTAVQVDKTMLMTRIAEAQKLLDETEEGYLPGQYPPIARADLTTAIAVAQVVVDNAAATEVEVTNAVQVLEEAVISYRAMIVPEPDAPVWRDGELTVYDVTQNSVGLGWPEAEARAGISGYHIYVNQDSVPVATVSSSVYSHTIIDLQPGTPYTFTVVAFNAAGVSPGLNGMVTTWADKASLQNKLNEARNRYDSTREGSANGQFPAIARAAFAMAIGTAQSVLDQSDVTQIIVDEAFAALEKALIDYNKAVITQVSPPSDDSVDYASSNTGSYSNDTDIQSLELMAEGTLLTLNPVFHNGITRYTAETTAAQIGIKVAVKHHAATIQVNGTALLNGSARVITLQEGENLIELAVRAEDGTTKIYQVVIQRKHADPHPNGPSEIVHHFHDIVGHWSESQVLEAADLGLIRGYPDGSFKPDQPLAGPSSS